MISDLYIPLTVINAAQEIEIAEQENIGIKIEGFPAAFIPIEQRILITDTAGMGKSTLLKYLFMQCIQAGYAVPIFIELRHLSESQSIIDLLLRELNYELTDEKDKFSKDDLSKILKKGGLLFFFDGYDEVPFKAKETVTRDIKRFIETYTRNNFVLTSRPESGLAAFPNFTHYRIRALEREESFSLIKKYDKNGKRSQQLIERLRGPDLAAVSEFLENPLLTTLLYRCFEYKQNIPEKKHVFYRQVFDALFDWHDASKDGYNTREKKSKLDLDGFHRVLRVIGFISVLHGEVEGDKDKVLSWIREAKSVCVGLSFPESDFLDDATTAVPVFVKEGLHFKWSHKSLAEYFAAQYLCTEGKEQQAEVFEHMKANGSLERFQNVLDQVYDLDQSAFRKHFTLPFAQEFLDFSSQTYKKLNAAIPAEEVELRRALTYCSAWFFVRVRANGKYPLPSGTELHGVLDALGYPYTKEAVKELWDLSFGGGRVTFSNIKGVILAIGLNRHCHTIGDILSTKNDPLMALPADLSTPLKQPSIKNLGKAALLPIVDNPNDGLNTPENFRAVNRALLMLRGRYGSLPCYINSNACKSFVSSFSDQETKEAFTKGLLSKLKGKRVSED